MAFHTRPTVAQLAIVALLVLNVVILIGGRSEAARKPTRAYQTLVVNEDMDLERQANTMAKQGWRVLSVLHALPPHRGYLMVLEKE